jgi:hypothetical protein
MIKPKSAEDLKLPASWNRPGLLLAVGFVSLLLSVAISFFGIGAAGSEVFFRSYLANVIFAMSFGIGGLFFVLIVFLCRASWSTSIRRVAEIMASTLPLMAVAFIPIIVLLYANSQALYEWNATAAELKADHQGLVAEKTGYLNRNFFTIRTIIYFLALGGMGAWIFKTSRQQDETGDAQLTLNLQKWSGPLIMVFALTVSFAAFDWIMSLDADWFSTIFGVYWFAASMMATFAFMIVTFTMLQKNGKTTGYVNIEHFHDMGKFLFGFVMFWAYIAFSQLILYWYGNIPEETAWYEIRYHQGWAFFSYMLIAAHFVIPFLALLSRHVRRHRAGLTFWAFWALAVHWLDMTYLILPAADLPEALSIVGLAAHLFCGIGISSLFLALLVYKASDTPLIAVRDPRMDECLHYANPLF